MIVAFLLGSAFEFSGLSTKIFKNAATPKRLRSLFYQAVVMYLLFRIGFIGGVSITSEPLNEVLFTSFIAVAAAVVWTFFILSVLKRWSPFSRLTQISIAAHFGSVSVGTFVAGLAFLAALNIEVSGSVAVWLAVMELPAILVGMWMLKISFAQVFKILIEDRSLMILLFAIAFGIAAPNLIPTDAQKLLFTTIFTPLLVYFLFEMGRKATASFGQLKGNLGSVIMVGVLLPILGGALGVSMGALVGYTEGQAFMLGLLMASASYVLAPISLNQILNSLYHPTAPEIKNVVAVSMALSVGVTLPFNVLIGFELYYLLIKAVSVVPALALVSFAVLGLVWGVSLMGKK